ncbi:AAA family ATPase [Photobacterium carnosum]|uniref:AAA family ATPase n=1 Tax=Photobacterium carnosum TaxID=2023717 RepID=UPI001E63D728|nr:AAA family ATPase [Photobacterium carnosum]MCD9496844.1 AAA family ATPase [Photobacterium carnosum]
MNREINHAKTIRSLKLKAKNNFYSALQLSSYYGKGKYVDKDEVEEKKYLSKAYDLFKEQGLFINELSVSNYRLFSTLEIKNLDRNLNIFIGNNGAGKTTILDALDLSLSWLSISINKNGGSGSYIDENDINTYNESSYSSVNVKFEINKNIKANISINKSKDGRIKVRNALSEIKAVGGFYKVANDFEPLYNMPLLAYYNVMRSYDVNPKDLRQPDLREITSNDKFDAYQKSLDGKTDFSKFFQWYKKIDDILIRRKANDTSSVSSDIINKLRELFDNDQLSTMGEKEKLTLIEVLGLSEEPEDIEVESKKENHKELKKIKKIVDALISDFMGDIYSNIEIVIEPKLDILISKRQRKISVMRLSQGEKTLLALILDIARRLIILNPSLENPLHGSGVILIDEFDLHLHPKWQKNVALKLVNNFPNCQFFLTTHSPLVITETNAKNVFIINEEDDGSIAIFRPNQTYGLDSNQVLDELMKPLGVESLSRPDFINHKINEINNLIDKETNASLLEAEERIKELEKKINGDIPDLVEASVRLESVKLWIEDNEEDS